MTRQQLVHATTLYIRCLCAREFTHAQSQLCVCFMLIWLLAHVVVMCHVVDLHILSFSHQQSEISQVCPSLITRASDAAVNTAQTNLSLPPL